MAIAVVAVAMVGCGSSDDDAATPSTTAYAPAIDPASFTDEVTNRWFPLEPGTVFVYEGTSEGEPERNEVTVTTETKVVAGVRCVVVHDVVYAKGEVAEDTFDWYAQDRDGAVWYFGEDTKEMAAGKVTSVEGSWEAGVDGAHPGIVMPARPEVGRTYRQEYLRGVAEDMATILRIDGTVTVPAGTYEDVVVTKDFSPLEPDVVDQKRYAPGVGFVESDVVRGPEEHVELVRIEHTTSS